MKHVVKREIKKLGHRTSPLILDESNVNCIKLPLILPFFYFIFILLIIPFF